MRKRLLLLFLSAGLLLIALFWFVAVQFSASSSPQKDLAEQALSDFHDAYNRRDFAAIYKVTGSDYRRMMSEAAMQKLLENAHKKLGRVVTYTETGFQIAGGFNGVDHITITVETEYADGMVPERFNYTVYKGKVLMEGYHIEVPR